MLPDTSQLTRGERARCLSTLRLIKAHPGTPESTLLANGAHSDAIVWLSVLDLIDHDKGGWWTFPIVRVESDAVFGCFA